MSTAGVGGGADNWLGLRGKVCVVTGAGSGIGAATAQALAAVGAHVALVDLNGDAAKRVADGLREQGAMAIAVACDTSKEAAVKQAAAAVRSELGACSVLVNNAGLLRAGSLQSVSLDDWNFVLSVNLTGYLLCAREFGRDMLEAKHGSIVHIASIAGSNPQTGSGSYSASKAGVRLLSKQMAVEWGPSGVRSNAVCPGMIKTALSEKFYEQPGFEERRAAVTASRRVGVPVDIANAVVFLASERADYVNGAELMVDGGLDNMVMDMVPRPGFNAT
ncbi:MAG: SDR family NAD(P)-dependent oxidoreductase [Janthinobacterium lividum]